MIDFQGPSVPGGAKFSIVGISPQTGTYADTAAGANWGPSIKDAGYDLLILEGKSEKPVYLHIVDDEIATVLHLSLVDGTRLAMQVGDVTETAVQWELENGRWQHLTIQVMYGIILLQTFLETTSKPYLKKSYSLSL